jgi:hypothetical protein
MATPNRPAPAQPRIAHVLPLEKTLKDAAALAARFRDAEGFRAYFRKRMLLILPAWLLFMLSSIAFAAATVIFLADRHPLLALPGLLLAPLVLVGSLFVQSYVFFSWLEGRALAHALKRRRLRPQGAAAAWMVKKLGIDLGDAPRVPWTLAAIFVAAPLGLLAAISMKATLVLILLGILTPIFFARFDR